LTKGFAFEKDEHLLFALRNSWVENNPDDLKNLSGGAVDYRPNAASNEVLAVIRQQVGRFQDTPDRELVWLQALAARATADDIPLLLERGAKHPALLAAIQTAPVGDPAPLLEPLWANADPAVQREAVRLSGLWKARTFTDRVRTLAFDAASPLRGPAFSALLVLDTDAAVAARLEALRSAPDAAATAPLLTSLLAQAEGHAGLVRALGQPDVLTAAAAKRALQALNQIGRAEPKLTAPLMKLAGLNPALPVYTKEYVANLVKAAKTFGNAEEGKKIYETAGCIACHIPGAAQSKIGPDLSAISRGLPPELIVTEVVWPALNVKEGYEAATVTMKDGTVLTGFKQTETAEAIAVRDLATGVVKSIPKSETQAIQAGGTVMPDGLTAGMDERQLAHLVRYLMGLGAD
jgi:putative heme-binding domain-containing protein